MLHGLNPSNFLLFALPLLVPAFLAMIDFTNVMRSRRKHRKACHGERELADLISLDHAFVDDAYSILIPIFGHIRYLKNIEFLKQYGSKVVLCTTTQESPEFIAALTEIAKQYHFRMYKSEVRLSTAKHKPNPWKLFHLTLKKSKVRGGENVRDEIIRDSFSEINTPYCIFLDGDTTAKQHFSYLVATFRAHNYDIASVRVLVSRQKTIMERLQAVEYELAMDARRLYPWLTSGACMIARTEIIKDIMMNHSLFFSGGDIEIGKLSCMKKYRVGHIPFDTYTDVPETFRAWFKQRMAWCGGGFRHTIVNCTKYIWRHPFYFIYFTILVYGATPLRWYEFIQHPLIIPFVIGFYWILIVAIYWKTMKWYYLLFPFYALVQVMLIVPLGVYVYFKMARHSRNFGIIKLRQPRHHSKKLNLEVLRASPRPD